MTAFNSLQANIDLNEKNITINELTKKSEGFDFAKEDRVPEDQFNEVLWKGIKGMDAIVPAPKRAAFVKNNLKKDDDD